MQTYMIDTFGNYAASALAATVLLRSIFGMIFSIFGEQLYVKLDYGWYVLHNTNYTIIRLIYSTGERAYWRSLLSRPYPSRGSCGFTGSACAHTPSLSSYMEYLRFGLQFSLR